MRTDHDVETPGLVVTRTGPISEAVVGHGTRYNALTDHDWHALSAWFTGLRRDDTVRVVVLRGRADTFCSGSDITAWATATPDEIEASFQHMEAAFRAVEQCPVPVIAQIEGIAAGAGCQLALACDLRVMADSARIGMPIARLGILASPSFAARLATLTGPGWARRLLYTGELMAATTAVRIGLAEEAVAPAELGRRVREFADRIACQPPAAIRAAKQSVAAALRPVQDATADNPRPAVSLPDFRRGVTEFLTGDRHTPRT